MNKLLNQSRQNAAASKNRQVSTETKSYNTRRDFAIRDPRAVHWMCHPYMKAII